MQFIHIQIYIHIDTDIYTYKMFKIPPNLRSLMYMTIIQDTKVLKKFLMLCKNWHLFISPPTKTPPLLLKKIIKTRKTRLCLA